MSKIILVYRGVSKKLPNNIGVGSKFYFPEILSTSNDINVAKGFAGSGTLIALYLFFGRDILVSLRIFVYTKKNEIVNGNNNSK